MHSSINSDKELQAKKAKVRTKKLMRTRRATCAVRSGRGKGYMRSRDQEENAPIAFKKIDVPRKTRSLTVADNIVEEPVAVELAKSINIEEKRHQQHAIMTQLTSDHQINKDIDDTYAEWGQAPLILRGPPLLVPSCCVIFDLEPLSLSFDFVFSSEIFKSSP
ncbi:hypothetical protein Tco_0613995 [Tanacetum coccineum]